MIETKNKVMTSLKNSNCGIIQGLNLSQNFKTEVFIKLKNKNLTKLKEKKIFMKKSTSDKKSFSHNNLTP